MLFADLLSLHLVTFLMFFILVTAYRIAVLEILRNLFVLAYIACPRYPYI